jgi:putative tricarboxylic transport membrane protein
MIPGINSTIAMALLLPFTYTMSHTNAIMLLAGVYCGGEYGGSIPACLIGTPGTNAAACTVIDGYALSQKGRTGLALYTSLMASCFGGILSAIFLLFLALPLSQVALAFGPAEYFALAFLGLSMVCSLGEKNVFKGIFAGALGVMLSTIGFDTFTGVKRYTMGFSDLSDGVSMVALMMGLYAITEMITQAQSYRSGDGLSIADLKPDLSFPKWKEIKPLIPWAIFAGFIGLFVGVMPGAGATAASFLAYNEVKRWSKAEGFGQGNPLGIVGPEAANNAVTGGAMVPLLSLGIPGSNSTAIMLAAFSIHNVKCGPTLFNSNPEIPFGIVSLLCQLPDGGDLIFLFFLYICLVFVANFLMFLCFYLY